MAGAPGFISDKAYGAGGVDAALRNSAAWACIDVLMDALARTPMDGTQSIRGRSVYMNPQPQLLVKPSGVVGLDVWRGQVGYSMLTDGNAFGRVVAMDTRANPTQIEMVDSYCVTERKVVDGIPSVLYDNERHNLWPYGDMWHVPGRLVPAGSPFALSPVTYSAKVTGTTLAAEDFSLQFFTDGGHPTMAFYVNAEITEQQGQAIKDSYRRGTRGGREPAVFGSDIRMEHLQTDPNATGYIDLMRFEVEQACRFWRVPPSMVYAAISGQNITYANVSDADLSYLKHSLDGYLVRLENALTAITAPWVTVKANRNAILRSDVKARNEVYDIRLKNSTMTVNEVRALEDESPLTGEEYDVPGIPASPAELAIIEEIAIRSRLASPDEIRADHGKAPIPDGTGKDFYGPNAPGKPESAAPAQTPADATGAAAAPAAPAPKK
jgi:HK97 family phage portal protein